MELIKILKELELREDFVCGFPQNKKEIENLEKKLNLRFPSGYKVFLKKYGYMAWGGVSIYGPSDDDYYDLVTRNREARETKFPDDFLPLPNDAFVFTEYPGGGYYMLFSANSPREGQVGLFLDETNNYEEQTWESFEAFLEDALKYSR